MITLTSKISVFKTQDAISYSNESEENQIFDILVGLNSDHDLVRVQVLGKTASSFSK